MAEPGTTEEPKTVEKIEDNRVDQIKKHILSVFIGHSYEFFIFAKTSYQKSGNNRGAILVMFDSIDDGIKRIEGTKQHGWPFTLHNVLIKYKSAELMGCVKDYNVDTCFVACITIDLGDNTSYYIFPYIIHVNANVAILPHNIAPNTFDVTDIMGLNVSCSNCKKVIKSPQRCGRCLSVFYCNVECQREDFIKSHKVNCLKYESDFRLLALQKRTKETISIKYV